MMLDLETFLSGWGISTGSDMTVQGAYDWIVSDLGVKLDLGWPVWLVEGLLGKLDELFEDTTPDTAFQVYNDWALTGPDAIYDIMYDYEELTPEEVDATLSPSVTKYIDTLNSKVSAASSSAEAHEQGELSNMANEAWEQTKEDLTSPTAWPWWLQAAALGVGFILIRDVMKVLR
jgi:hypothetical protein